MKRKLFLITKLIEELIHRFLYFANGTQNHSYDARFTRTSMNIFSFIGFVVMIQYPMFSHPFSLNLWNVAQETDGYLIMTIAFVIEAGSVFMILLSLLWIGLTIYFYLSHLWGTTWANLEERYPERKKKEK